MKKLVSIALVFVACGGETPTAKIPAASGPSPVPPARAINLRASFDRDPTSYAGRFVMGADLKDKVYDESAGATTVCSKFFETKVVETDQEMEESMYTSSKVSASLSIMPVATGATGSQSQNFVRVKYHLKKKLQTVVKDASGLAACCADNKTACSSVVLGDYLSGDGEIFAFEGAQNESNAVAGNAAANSTVSSKNETGWKKVSSFKDVYFAFTPTSVVTTDTSIADCSFCDRLPQSDKGSYFCGVSSPNKDESMARDYAMRDARKQVVQYMATKLDAGSSSKFTAGQGMFKDEAFVNAASEGMATRVKAEKFCAPKVMPDGSAVVKVLALFPTEEEKSAAEDIAKRALAIPSVDLTKEQKELLQKTAGVVAPTANPAAKPAPKAPAPKKK